ncbi:GTP cyclohydrolase 1 [Zancudomyces culisetae]|uniref:GTP cyclohydrolase 1 n=1 Tax=Zancudomyces culisetae TaxID=1213189 RepID=A0A1R1PYE9_ZANCU|nr:GTP cyclohydrolase 1 [Zancudomyces culisetae]|eukprot:OMH85947.1 GTP cyclohydrolase 1 [Zancudomyces culisetae]
MEQKGEFDSIKQDVADNLRMLKLEPSVATTRVQSPNIFLAKKKEQSKQISIYESPAVEEDGLSWPSLGARDRINETEQEKEQRIKRMAGAVKVILECIGEDVDRQGILKTPERYAKALLFFTKGYEESLSCKASIL